MLLSRFVGIADLPFYVNSYFWAYFSSKYCHSTIANRRLARIYAPLFTPDLATVQKIYLANFWIR